MSPLKYCQQGLTSYLHDTTLWPMKQSVAGMDRAGIGGRRAAAPPSMAVAGTAPVAEPAALLAVVSPEPVQAGPPGDPARPGAAGGVADVLEQQVLPRLLQRHGLRADTHAPDSLPVGARWLAALARAVEDDALQLAVARLHAQGLTGAAIASEWLAPAARELGQQWERDECSFADVTIGVGRMQRALHRLECATALPALAARRVLLVLAPGEQHSFGLAVIGEAFRREGWDVVGASEVTAVQAPGCVARERFDLVGISVGSQATAAGVPALCGALRRASRHAGMAILVGGPYVALGGPLVTPDHLGADALAADVETALSLARQRLSTGHNPFTHTTLARSKSPPPAREGSPPARPRSTETPAAMRR